MPRQGGLLSRGTPACLVLALAFSLADAGDLRVRVVDAPAGAPLAGASVLLSGGSGPLTLATDADGIAWFRDLPEGRYGLEVDLPGYSGVRFDDVEVPAEGLEDWPVVLVADLQEQVRVSGQRSPVELDRTTNATKFDDNFIESLPVQNRFLQNMITFAPGVLDADEDGNPNVHGARTGDFKFMVNGVSNTDPLTGEYLSFVNLESVEEIEVITAGAGVEYGRAQGGFANVLQKQGGDELQAVIGFTFRSNELDGNGAANVRKERIPEYEWFQPFVQLSGPIVKGKLWYRLSHEYIDREEPINFLGQNVVLQRREQTINSDQLTWQVAPSHKLTLNYLYDPLRIENANVTSTIPEESSFSTERGGTTWTLTWQNQQSPRFLMDTLVAWQDHEFDLFPTEKGVDNDCLFSDRVGTLAGGQCFYTNSGVTSGSYFVEALDNRRRFTFKTDGVWYPEKLSSLGLRFKFGMIVENEKYTRDLTRGMEITWTTMTVPITFFTPLGRIGFADTLFGVPRESRAEAKGTAWGSYIESQIQPRSDLVVTLGVRFDVDAIDTGGFSEFDPEAETRRYLELRGQGLSPTDAMARAFTAYENLQGFTRLVQTSLDTRRRFGLRAIQEVSKTWVNRRRKDSIYIRHTHLSPRLTLAWDPTGDGKTKLALSAGRYYDKLPLSVPLVELEPPIASASFTAFPLGRFPRQLTAPWKEFTFSALVNPTRLVRVVDRDLKTPYQDELALSFERELWAESQIKLSYIKREFRDQLQDIDINHVPGDYGQCRLQLFTSEPSVVASPGSGQTLVNPFNGKRYVDTDPGDGDGRVDDCLGGFTQLPQTGRTFNGPDGIVDLYVQNPAWGDVLKLGNFNETDYEAVVLELVRRWYRGWEINGSYTWSTAEGDGESFIQDIGNDRALLRDTSGYLAYDQRHVVKINAAALTPWGIRVGGTVRWESGLPYSSVNTENNPIVAPPQFEGIGGGFNEQRLVFPSGQRNDLRNPSYWTFDVRVAREFEIGADAMFSVTLEVFNLLNDDTLRVTQRRNGFNEGFRRFGRQFQVGMRARF
jgi:hypothetical protein